MKKLPSCLITLSTVMFFVFFSSCGQQADRPEEPARQSFRAAPRIISPELLPDNRVTFRLYAKDASSVTITGEWQQGFGASEVMMRNDTGLFSLTVGPLKPELYAYNFTVDGVKVLDPANVKVRRDGSNYQNFFIIPGPESDLYFHKHDVPHGTVSKVWYHSDVLGFDRRMYVYTPPDYNISDNKYPVFYLLHGAGGDEDAWTNMGRTAQIMDNLIARGKAIPMIVVMTNGNANQAGAQNEVPPLPTTTGGRGQEDAVTSMVRGGFEQHLVKDVIPFIEENYKVMTGKDKRAIAGLSMGGMHTQTITYDNPGMFGYIGVFSMGLMNFGPQNRDEEAVEKERDEKIEALKNSGYELYWIACGTDDFLYESVTTLREVLDKHDFRYIYRESSGGHTWANWRIYLSEFSPMLFK